MELIFIFLLISPLLIGLFLLKNCFYICPPETALIIFGRKNEAGNFQIIKEGKGFCLPIVQQVFDLSLKPLPITIQLSNVYVKGASISILATATIRISNDDAVMRAAVERFLGRDSFEIQRVGQEQLEGLIRALTSTTSVQDLNTRRRELSNLVIEKSIEDFAKLGLQVESFTFQTAAVQEDSA